MEAAAVAAAAAQCFSDTGLDLPSPIEPWEVSSLEQFESEDIWECLNLSLSSESNNNSYPSFKPPASTASNALSVERPKKIPRTRAPDAPSPTILSFGGPGSLSSPHSEVHTRFVGGAVEPKEMEPPASRGSKRSYETRAGRGPEGKQPSTSPPSHNQDHAMAEKKRRENFRQKLIALSAIVPGLKKMDKASVLGDAINYLHQLQEKVKILEDQATKRAVESAFLMRKSHLSTDDDSSSCDENFDGHPSGASLPEITVKMSEKTVLMRIHCENRKGVLAKALSVIESFRLTVVNANAIPFTGSALDITITAQIDEGFSMTVKDLLKNLNSTFRQFK